MLKSPLMNETVHKTVCPLDCPDTCTMLVTVENGRVTRLQGDPEHPFTRGFLCHKVSRYDRRLYSDQRVLYPGKRVGKKGEGRFARITWDEALDDIASRFQDIVREYGAEAILPSLTVVRSGSCIGCPAIACSIAWAQAGCCARSAILARWRAGTRP